MRLSDVQQVSTAQKIVGNSDIKFSFSQFGEDLFLYTLLGLHDRLNRKGFYIDVGAFHPVLDSNTHLLRLVHGWTGLNIDANPDNIALFDQHCPESRNVCALISDVEEEVTFNLLDMPGMGTADPQMVARAERIGRTVTGRQSMRTRRLDEVIADSLRSVPPIDFLNVDVEGYDLKVLRSNDWNKYRPLLILVEDLAMDLERVSENPIKRFMNSVGYNIIGHGFVTSIYRDRTV
jgi:FkbM family methyltransferase